MSEGPTPAMVAKFVKYAEAKAARQWASLICSVKGKALLEPYRNADKEKRL